VMAGFLGGGRKGDWPENALARKEADEPSSLRPANCAGKPRGDPISEVNRGGKKEGGRLQ